MSTPSEPAIAHWATLKAAALLGHRMDGSCGCGACFSLAHALREERERCARIADAQLSTTTLHYDKQFVDGMSFAAQYIAAKIREGK